MTKLNLGSGAHPLDGFLNLDKQDGWRFEQGLYSFEDSTVEAVTVSHALMYVKLDDWPQVFSEIARVLKPGGVVRITEDATDNPRSPRYGGCPDAQTLTSEALVKTYLHAAGLRALTLDVDTTAFRDDSLKQAHHGPAPKVFFVEGIKP